MSGFNLPPGCRISDIPGNRPEDIAHEKMVDEIESALNPLTHLPLTDDKLYDEVFDNAMEHAIENLVKLINKAFEDGYQQATSDAAEAKFYETDQPTES